LPEDYNGTHKMALTSGTKLGPYEIIAQIGAGGMGEVYRARDPNLGRDVAIKVLPSFFSRDPDRLRRFEQEARAAAALNHPNTFPSGTYPTPSRTARVPLGGECADQRYAGPSSIRDKNRMR
jgi:serine/threonine protein kinase